MITRKDLEANYKVIRRVCEMYRKELTMYQAAIIDECPWLDVDVNDYIKFMNALPLDIFVGNLLIDLLKPDGIDTYKELMTNKITFKEFIERAIQLSIINIDKFYELMEQF